MINHDLKNLPAIHQYLDTFNKLTPNVLAHPKEGT